MDSIGILCNDAAIEEGAVLARRILRVISDKFPQGDMKVVFILYSIRSTPETCEHISLLEELGKRYRIPSKVEAVEAGRIEEVAEGISRIAKGLLTLFIPSTERELIEALKRSRVRLEVSEVLTPVPVSDIMSKEVFTLPPGTVVQEAAREACKRNIGFVVVVERGQVLGVATSQDMMKVLLAENPATLRLRDIMSSPAVYVNSGADIMEVSKVMREKKVKRLPVLEGGRLVGIVSVTDFLKIRLRYRE